MMYRIHQITSKGIPEMILNRGLLTTQKIQRSSSSSKRPPTFILFKPRKPSLINVKSKTAACSPFKSREVPKFGFSPTCVTEKLPCEKKTSPSTKSCSEAKPKPLCDNKEPPPLENLSCEKNEPPAIKKPSAPTTDCHHMSSEQKKQSKIKSTGLPETKPQATISSRFKSHNETESTPKTPPQTDISSASKTKTNTNNTTAPVKSPQNPNTPKTTAITTSKKNTPAESMTQSKTTLSAPITKPEISTSSDTKKTFISSPPFVKQLPRSEQKIPLLATAAHAKPDKTVTLPVLKKPKTPIEKTTSSNIIYDFKKDPPIERGFVEIPKKYPIPNGPQLHRSTTSTSKSPPKRSKIDSQVYVNNYIQHLIKFNAIQSPQPSKAATKVNRIESLIRQGLIERSKGTYPTKKISNTDGKLYNIHKIEIGNKKNSNLKIYSKKKADANLKVINDKKADVGKEEDIGKKADVNNKLDVGKKVNASPGDSSGKELKKKINLIRPHFNDQNLQHPSAADNWNPRNPQLPPTRPPSPEPPKKTLKSHNVYSEDATQSLKKKIDSEKIRKELANQFHSDDTFPKDQNSTKPQHFEKSEFLWLRPSQSQPKKTFISNNVVFEEAIKNKHTNNSVGEDLTLKESLQRLEFEIKRRNDIMQLVKKISTAEIKIRIHLTHDNGSPPSISNLSHKSHGNLTSKWDPKNPSGSRGKHTYATLISDINNQTKRQTKAIQLTPDRKIEVQAETKVNSLDLLQATIAHFLQICKVALINKDH